MIADTGSDVILSTSIAIARNISGYKFVSTYSAEEKTEIQQNLKKIANTLQLRYSTIGEMSPSEKTLLVENNFASKGFVLDAGNCVLHDSERDVFGIVCDDNHITIKKRTDALAVQRIYEDCRRLADTIGKDLIYAFDDDFGYITTNIDELGTGTSASFLLHVPALGFSGELNALFRQILEIGCEITSKSVSAFGPNGAFFTIRLPVIPREHEQYVIEKIEPAIWTIINRERAIRNTLLTYPNWAIWDKVGRSYGIARYAYELSYEEFISIVSDLRFGMLLKMIQSPDERIFDIYSYHDPIYDVGLQNQNSQLSEAQYRSRAMKKIVECITFSMKE